MIGVFETGERTGTYWEIRTDIADYQLANCIACDVVKTTALANTPTRLKALDASVQERLINWGYAVCDAAIRTHVEKGAAVPKGLPYPRSGVGESQG